MANPLDRTWYNTLVDDDGSGNTGTVWNKSQVNSLLNSVDAALAPVVANPSPVDITVARVMPRFVVSRTGNTAKGRLFAHVDNRAMLATNHYTDDAGVWQKDNPALPSSGVACNDGNVTLQMTPAGPISAPVPMLTAAGAGYVQINGGQLQWPAVQSPSTDPYTLDDYREGPITPTIVGVGGTSGNAYSLQTGYYTKIGRVVIAEFAVALFTKGTITGNVAIGGFPFAASIGHASAMIQFYGLATGWVTLRAGMVAGQTYAALTGATIASTNNIVALTGADIGSATDLRGVIMYHV